MWRKRKVKFTWGQKFAGAVRPIRTILHKVLVDPEKRKRVFSRKTFDKVKIVRSSVELQCIQ